MSPRPAPIKPAPTSKTTPNPPQTCPQIQFPPSKVPTPFGASSDKRQARRRSWSRVRPSTWKEAPRGIETPAAVCRRPGSPRMEECHPIRSQSVRLKDHAVTGWAYSRQTDHGPKRLLAAPSNGIYKAPVLPCPSPPLSCSFSTSIAARGKGGPHGHFRYRPMGVRKAYSNGSRCAFRITDHRLPRIVGNAVIRPVLDAIRRGKVIGLSRGPGIDDDR